MSALEPFGSKTFALQSAPPSYEAVSWGWRGGQNIASSGGPSIPTAVSFGNSGLVARPKTEDKFVAPVPDDTDARIAAHSFNLKSVIALYSMHLTSENRTRLFKQIDRLLSADSWHDDDPLPNSVSFTAFLKWSVFSHWKDWTAIGISDDGNLLVSWRRAEDRITAEVRPTQIRWTTSMLVDGIREIATGRCALTRFPAVIESSLSPVWGTDGSNPNRR